MIIASRLGPAKPRAITWKGAGGCVIVSQDRQLNFSRTCCVSMWATPLRCPACPQRCRGSNPPTPATQSDLPLTFLRYPENRAVARYFAGEEPVSTDGFGGFNGLRGQAEQAARDLLVRFPDVHDGYDRLGMVYEARGDNRQAADCYRKVIAFIREHPDDYEPGFEDVFVKLVNRLDPLAAT